jgi:hypothetical protein
MLLVRGTAAGTELTGTLYERGERAPTFRGAPDEGAAYTWVCDEFYEVESGGLVQSLADRDVQVAFEEPVARGFDTREAALAGAREHIRTQFARLGVDSADVDIEVVDADEEPGRA